MDSIIALKNEYHNNMACLYSRISNISDNNSKMIEWITEMLSMNDLMWNVSRYNDDDRQKLRMCLDDCLKIREEMQHIARLNGRDIISYLYKQKFLTETLETLEKVSKVIVDLNNRNFLLNPWSAVTKWLQSIQPQIDAHAVDDCAFRYACENEHFETVKWLKQTFPQIQIKNEFGKTENERCKTENESGETENENKKKLRNKKSRQRKKRRENAKRQCTNCGK